MTSSAVQQAWSLLESIPDPEIPVVSIRELGILRDIHEQPDGSVDVVITPTYSGCPAMDQIADDVRGLLARHAIAARVVTQLAPAWTTDWITPEGRERLREYGIAPPGSTAAAQVVRMATRQAAQVVPCPRCDSHDTTEISHFASTACKALYRCLACREPFDHFKPY